MGNEGRRYNPEIHHRRSIRLKSYDYSQAGAYFITLCVQERLCVFGEIDTNGWVMRPNEAGLMVQEMWERMPQWFPNIELDYHVVMPNHFHAIVVTITAVEKATLGRIVGAFKSITTNEYAKGVRADGWQAFPGKLWQRDYYEHIIRHEEELNQIRQYIEYNPARWVEDKENPANP